MLYYIQSRPGRGDGDGLKADNIYVGDNMVKPRNEWNKTAKTKQNEWRKKNRALLGADLPKQEGDAFRALCKASGVSVSAALSVFVRAAIQAGTLDIIQDDIPGTRDDDAQG